MDTNAERLSEPEVRHALNQWSRQGWFRLKQLGDQIQIEDVLSCSSYALTLQTEYERRSVWGGMEPYYGGMVDDTGVPPDAWEIEIAPPAGFEERTEQWRIPHTEQVAPCRPCFSSGQVDCNCCFGSGKRTCAVCNGSGVLTRTENRSQVDAFGNVSYYMVTVTESCSCFGGHLTCTCCNGSGKETCSLCKGAGQIKTYNLLTVEFRCATFNEVMDSSAVPDRLVGQARGEPIVQMQESRIGEVPGVTSEVDARIRALLAQAQAGQEDGIIRFQYLLVSRIGVCQVRYRYLASKPRDLWIYGDEPRVYAPGAPLDWRRVAPAVAAALILLAVLIFAVNRLWF